GRGHARYCLRRGRAGRPRQPARRDRRGAADRHRAEHCRCLLDRGVAGGDLRRGGGGIARSSPGLGWGPVSSSAVAILAAVRLFPLGMRHALGSEIWIFAIFGLGLNLLLGYTGLLSFGQATFFGSAAYVAGWLLKHLGINAFAALGIGVAVGAASAALVGYLCVQRSGLSFIMLTFELI